MLEIPHKYELRTVHVRIQLQIRVTYSTCTNTITNKKENYKILVRERYIGLGFVFIWSKITRAILTFSEEATWWFGLITMWQMTSQLWKLKMDFRCWNHKHKINWENFLNILICLGVSPGIPSVWYWGLQTISKVENKNINI